MKMLCEDVETSKRGEQLEYVQTLSGEDDPCCCFLKSVFKA